MGHHQQAHTNQIYKQVQGYIVDVIIGISFVYFF